MGNNTLHNSDTKVIVVTKGKNKYTPFQIKLKHRQFREVQ